MENLDVPITEAICPRYLVPVEPQNQIRLEADECGMGTPIIGFDCPKCGMFQSIPDDVEILSAEIIY